MTRGEFDELYELQSTLERCKPVKLGYHFYSKLMFSLARTGNLDLLETLLRFAVLPLRLNFICIDINFELDINTYHLNHFQSLYYSWCRSAISYLNGKLNGISMFFYDLN